MSLKNPFRIISFNVRGIRDSVKRRAIFRHAHVKYPSHIIILQETHSSVEIENQWKAEWGGNIFFAHGEKTAKGVCALVPKTFRGSVNWLKSEQEGRTIILKINFNHINLNVLGIYAPTQSNERVQEAYYEELGDIIRNLDTTLPTVLCGDFNVHLTVSDTDNIRFRETRANKTLRAIMADMDLIDIWRELNPDKRRFSWRRCHPLQQSRIDYFLISKDLFTSQKVIRADIEPGVRSDHSVVVLEIIMTFGERGPGLWRFNNTLLDCEQLTDGIRSEIMSAKRLEGEYGSIANQGVLLEVLLGKIRVQCIRQSKLLARERRRAEIALEDKLKRTEELLKVSNSETFLEEYNEIKSQVDDYKTEAAKKAMLYSKAKWLEQGERPTKYFLNLEKKRISEKTIHVLENNDGELISGNRQILSACKMFYEELHKSKTPFVDRSPYMEEVLIPKLDDQERELCNGLITGEECFNALKSMGGNKAPSVSGFNKEFMLFFWDGIGEIIVRYVNEAYSAGSFFVNQRRGVLTLIPKAGDQTKLSNKRPICLLDIVYKIVAKVLANRLAAVIQKIINHDQTGFLRGRCIQDNLRLIQDAIDYASQDDLPGAICALDFKSAFNSVEHSFIFFALRKFGFGEPFIKWIKLLYTGTELAVINNGFTSDWFKPERGIMQGCPISGMLFIIAVELLAIRIRECRDIRGLNISGQVIKISQYADDTTVFVRDSDSMKVLMGVLAEFSKVSGLELNLSKSKLMWIGNARHSTAGVCGMSAVKRVKILGMWFSATENCHSANVQPIVDSIAMIMRMWQQRALSLKGRITVAKSLLISKFIYLMPCAKIDKTDLRIIQSHIMKFIWRGRPPKVASKVLCQSIERGGLGAVDVDSLYTSLKLGWVKKMVKDLPWTKLCQARCFPYSIDDLLKSRYGLRDLERFRLTEFYIDTLMTFRKMNMMKDPSDANAVRNELIWLNQLIKCNNKPLYEATMYIGGIRYVGDIVTTTGTFMTFVELKRKFTGLKINFLRYLGIVSAVPAVWKAKLKNGAAESVNDELNGEPTVIMNDKRITLGKMRTRDFYWLGIKAVKPTAVDRWEREGFIPDEWVKIFRNPYTCTKSTKLQAFQYRVIHRFIPTRRFLFVRHIVDSPKCLQCKENDTITHHFFGCPRVAKFWEDVFKYIHGRFRERWQLNVNVIIFGMLDAPPVISLLILMGKHYIHSCAMHQRQVSFDAFMSYVEDMRRTEQQAAMGDSDLTSTFKNKWKAFIGSASSCS